MVDGDHQPCSDPRGSGSNLWCGSTVPWCRSIRSGRLINAPDLGRQKAHWSSWTSPSCWVSPRHREMSSAGRSKPRGCLHSGFPPPADRPLGIFRTMSHLLLPGLWQYPVTAQVGRGPAGSIVSLLSTGEVRLIDWKTGQVQVLGTARIPELARCYVGADLHRFY